MNKSLNLKSGETYSLASRVSKLTGESMTEAVTIALQERLDRLEPQGSLADQLMAIGADCAKRLSPRVKRLDHATLLYDKAGLPKRSRR